MQFGPGSDPFWTNKMPQGPMILLKPALLQPEFPSYTTAPLFKRVISRIKRYWII
ncbi:hypothetical protein HY637_01590 [Candidatus Woesearchaeota archaeon]|nr:hypothetical protein [Candidatus Woesearchaeota archaeon]